MGDDGKDLRWPKQNTGSLSHIIFSLYECLSFFKPCVGTVVLTLSMCSCVGVRRNKQLFLYSFPPQSSSFFSDGRGSWL